MFHGKQRGFTILELLVATVAFLIVAGAALSLFQTEQPLLNRQQNFAALNIAMRNSVAQMQLDVVNAGTGYYPGTDISDWPIGVTITSSAPASACNTPSTFTYSSTCFDTLNVITTDPGTPAASPDNGGFTYNTSDCVITDAASPQVLTMYVAPTTGLSASNYLSGDLLLLVKTRPIPK